MNINSFSKLLKEARKEKGLTQKELSEKINSEQSFIARLENGSSFPSLETTVLLSKYLDIPKDKLWDEIQKQKFKKNKDKTKREYLEKFSVDYEGNNIESDVIHPQLEKYLVHPQELIELEKMSVKVLIITKQFWGDIQVVNQWSEWKNIILNNMEKGVEYIYLYPSDDETKIIAKRLENEYIKFPNVSFYPVSELKEIFMFHDCQEITLYNTKDFSDNYQAGFFLDIFNNLSKGKSDSIIHLKMQPQTVHNIKEWSRKKILTSKLLDNN